MNFSYRSTFMKVITNRRNAKDVFWATFLPIGLTLEIVCFLGMIFAKASTFDILLVMFWMLGVAYYTQSEYKHLAKKYIDFDGGRP